MGEGMDKGLLIGFVIWLALSIPAVKRLNRSGWDPENVFLNFYGGLSIGLLVTGIFRLFLI